MINSIFASTTSTPTVPTISESTLASIPPLLAFDDTDTVNVPDTEPLQEIPVPLVIVPTPLNLIVELRMIIA